MISPNLSVSSLKDKKSFATGALVESLKVKGLLYAGTDKGAFWVSKNDGVAWEENSSGLANNYIRSICPSQFAASRVYLAMTGINYDDLHSYLYASEDYGRNWKGISSDLPDEPVNVILEDPTNENILYAGGLRGVYISVNRGVSWSYLGLHMPATAIADLEIHTATMDLVVATHGRGIFKTNLKPIQNMINQNLDASKDHLFEASEIKTPWFNSAGGEPDHRTVEKATFSFWLSQPKRVTLSIRDKEKKEIWSSSLDGKVGFNQYRWDLVLSKETSDFPYFVHYDKFIQAGSYLLTATLGDAHFEKPILVIKGSSPYVK